MKRAPRRSAKTVAPPAEIEAGPDSNDRLFAVASGLVPGVLALATPARDVVVGDPGDFLTTAATLGVAHPPGYPLLVLLGHVFSLVPVGPLPFRINLVSAVSHAIAVALVFSSAR